MVAALKCIGVRKTELFVEDYSSASLLVHILVAVFRFHVLSRKVALLEFETYTILTKGLWEQVALYLLNEIKDSIPKYEISLVRGVSMQV